MLQFLKKLKFLTKIFFSQTYKIGLPKQSFFIHSSSKNLNLSTKIELLSHFYQKTCFFPVLPPISLYKSTHNKILGKRGKSVSLEFPYKAACKKLGNSDLQFSRTQLILQKRVKGNCSFEPTGPLPLSLLNAEAGCGGHLDRSVTCGAWVLWAWFVSIGLGAISFKTCGTRRKRAPEGCSFSARMSCETVSDELCRVF